MILCAGRSAQAGRLAPGSRRSRNLGLLIIVINDLTYAKLILDIRPLFNDSLHLLVQSITRTDRLRRRRLFCLCVCLFLVLEPTTLQVRHAACSRSFGPWAGFSKIYLNAFYSSSFNSFYSMVETCILFLYEPNQFKFNLTKLAAMFSPFFL